MKTSVKIKGQARLFENSVLEYFTKSSLLESTVSSLAISAACIWLGYWLGAGLTTGRVIAWVLGGVVSWSLFEYLLHRYIFHISERIFRGSRRFQYILHGVHHEYPNDAQRTLMPFLPKLIISSVFLGIFCLIFGAKGTFFSSGFMLGYYLYSMVHYSIHRYKPPTWLKPLWEHHHLHHHLHDDKAFGVSSRLWDLVFSTLPPRYENKSKVAGADRP